jgi:hypothetical protein
MPEQAGAISPVRSIGEISASASIHDNGDPHRNGITIIATPEGQVASKKPRISYQEGSQNGWQLMLRRLLVPIK